MSSLAAALLFASSAAAGPTEVRVVGTVHFPTEHVDAPRLRAELDAFEPDVILMEIDHTVFTDDYSLSASFEENEWLALRSWLVDHPDTAVRPYDREDRNATRRALGVGNMGKAFQVLHRRARHSPEDAATVARFDVLSAELRVLGSGPLEGINAPASDAVVEERQSLQYEALTAIAQRDPTMARRTVRSSSGERMSLRDQWVAYARFEREREATMVRNIRAHALDFEGQRVLVFAGFYHRPGLLQGLAPAVEAGELVLVPHPSP